MPKKNPHKGIFAPNTMKNAKIVADPVAQKMTDFRNNHPWLSKFGDMMTGGATDPNAELGPVDLLGQLPIGEVGKAGLPFAAYLSKLARGSLFHGTQKVFEHFDPSKYDKGDVLGWMTHFAENPEYAGTSYALGRDKGILNLADETGPVSKADVDPYLKYGTRQGEIVKPHIIPAIPEAKNVLDLVDPNPDDMAQAIASMNEYGRKDFIQGFKSARQYPDDYVDRLHNPIKAAEDALGKGPGIATRHIAEKLNLTPEEFANSPFDAIRYHDMKEKSWAIPEGTPIKSKFGARLTQEVPESPIKMRKMGEGEAKGNLPVRVSQDIRKIKNPALEDMVTHSNQKSPSYYIGSKAKVIYSPTGSSIKPGEFIAVNDKADANHIQGMINKGFVFDHEPIKIGK